MTVPGTEWQTCGRLRPGRTLPAVNWPDYRCIVEIDGPEHCEPVKFDADRRGGAQLQPNGHTVPWFTNVRVLQDVQAVVAPDRPVHQRSTMRIRERDSMPNDDLTPSDSAILIVLMAEARPMLNTDLVKLYRINVVKERREKLNRLQLVHSEKSGQTFSHVLDDKGWTRVHEDLDVSSPKARAIGGALAALHLNLRNRVLSRTGCDNLTEMFSHADIAPQEAPTNLEGRLRATYAALAAEPRAWVALARLRPFFEDVPRADLDEALRRLSQAPDVNLVPEENQKSLTAADLSAAVHQGGQDKHLLAIGV